jgi:sec-independent protein translocase protein TatA
MFEGLLSPMHLVIICAIALVVFGPKRLPEAGRGLGEALRGFRESVSASPTATEQQVPPPAPEDDER